MTRADDLGHEKASAPTPSGTRLLCPPDELTKREAHNLRDLHLFALNIVQDTPDRDPFTQTVILEMHRICVAGIYPSAGRFRRMGESVEVPGAGFQPAPVHMINAEIVDLLYRAKRVTLSGARFRWRINYAALALHRFLRIHPFLDGNGRVGRVFHQVMLYKLGAVQPPYIVYDFLLAYRVRYLEALRLADQGDFLPWFRLSQLAVDDANLQFAIDGLSADPAAFDIVASSLSSSDLEMMTKNTRMSLAFEEYVERVSSLISSLESL